jgi:hypothetical protein
MNSTVKGICFLDPNGLSVDVSDEHYRGVASPEWGKDYILTSLTHSPTSYLAYSLTHLIPRLLTHPPLTSLTHSPISYSAYSLTHLLPRLLTHLLTHSLIYSLTHLLIYSLTHSLFIPFLVGNDESVDVFYRKTEWTEPTDEMLTDLSLKLVALTNGIKKTFKNRNVAFVNNN